MSSNPESRLKEHNFGKVKSTRPFRPWIITYTEELKTLAEAREREVYLKSGFGRAYLDKILKTHQKVRGSLPAG